MTYFPRTTLSDLEFAYIRLFRATTQNYGRRCHEFICSAPVCKGNGSERRVVRRFLDTGDKGSTSNMRKHAKHCWGDDIIKKADEAREELTIDSIREGLAEAKKGQDGSIVAFFDRKGKGKVKYMLRQHTYEEARSVLETIQAVILITNWYRVEYVRWCAESMRSFRIVDDAGFHHLMKTGRPHIRIPSYRTVARDVHVVFKRVKQRIGKMLQVSPSDDLHDYSSLTIGY